MLYKEIKPNKKLKLVDYLETSLCNRLIGPIPKGGAETLHYYFHIMFTFPFYLATK